jgi:hypothetical protein
LLKSARGLVKSGNVYQQKKKWFVFVLIGCNTENKGALSLYGCGHTFWWTCRLLHYR